MKPVRQIIDESLKKMKEEIFPMTAIEEEVPKEMIDNSLEAEEDYIGWKAIKSEITNSEISKLEKELKCKLPKSYKEFLQYKYFMELHLADFAIRIHNILPKSKLENLKELNLNYNLPKEIIEKGYFYFADFHDFGLLAFDTNKPKEENEFEVIFMMHDNFENKYIYAKSFKELLNFDENYSNSFIEKLNEMNKK